MRLKDKRVIITAAASGMGKAGAELFAREGAKVALVDIDEERVNAVAEQINAAGGYAVALRADLLDPDNAAAVVREAAERLGGVDVLWNHAGMPGKAEIEPIDVAAYGRTMDLNIRTGLVMTGAAADHLREQGGGSVVFTASTAGMVGAAVSPIYGAAKAGVLGLTRSLARRYGVENIRVNAIAPGLVQTPMAPFFFDPVNGDPDVAKVKQERFMATVPLGRFVETSEVAEAALFLASDAASGITGIVLPIDGGSTC